MAQDLSHLIHGGYLFNRRRNSVFGQLYFHGREEPIHVELAGNCDPDLAGRGFEFTLPENSPWLSHEDEEALQRLDHRQIGPVVSITAARKVAIPRPGEDRTDWQLCLHLEWHGPNGHIIIRAPGATITLLDEHGHPLGLEHDTPAEAPPPPSPPESDDPTPLPFATEDSTDPFDGEPSLDSEYMRQLIAMDTQIECGDDVPLRDFFENTLDYPRPETLETEEEARQALIAVLAFLARMHISWDICVHCDYRQAYKLLIENVCDQESILPGISGTGFVTHFSSYEYCPECEREMEEDYKNYSPENDESDDPPH